MRKVSKNRTDDDAVSSTEGSHVDEPVAAEKEAENGGSDLEADEENNSANGEVDTSTADIKETPRAKRKSKAADTEDKDEESTLKERTKRKVKSTPRKKATVEEKEDSEEEEYEVESIVDSKKVKGKLHYLIRWKGYSSDNDTWEAEDTVSCPDLVKKYLEEQKNDKKDKTPKKGKRQASVSPSKRGRGKKGTAKSPAKKAKVEFDYENADENAEYEVEKILEVHHKKNGKREFLIHWKGWSSKHDSWEPEEYLSCPDLIAKFMAKVVAAAGMEERNLRVAPSPTRRFTLAGQERGRRLSKRATQRQRVRYDGAE